MSFLKRMGFVGNSPNPEPIKLHPGCSIHSTVISLWLTGSPVEVLNPSTGNWEDCEKPIFDPDHQYRSKMPGRVPPPAAAPVYVAQPVPAPQPPEQPAYTPAAPIRKFKRGEIWEAANGFKYLILGYKSDYVTNYNPDTDPDTGEVVVMRYEVGKKPAVSCRTLVGHRRQTNDGYNLVTKKVDTYLMDVNQYPLYEFGTTLYVRNGTTNPIVSSTTGEVVFA